MQAAPSIKIMGKNLAGKTASIIAVLVIFFYGIFFGFNAPKMGSLKTLIANNINLGLDLKGGTHLVLEVHVAEAIASAVDRDAARLEADLQKAGITGADRKSTRLNSSHRSLSRMPSSA